ncbi:hypothetical protein Tco_0947851 [Tanacetum coccineum]
MHDEFIASVYPDVHGNLKNASEEHILLENPLSSTGTLSSMKNLDFTFGDQFIKEKSPDAEPGKTAVDTEVESMFTVPIHQASSSVPPLSTPVINLSPPKPVSSPFRVPTTTVITTTTLLLPPPPQQQSKIDSELSAHVLELETRCAELEKKNNNMEDTSQNLGSRVFMLELRDLPHKIDQTVNEVVKDVVRTALQAPLKERFKDLPEADMKEMLHQ